MAETVFPAVFSRKPHNPAYLYRLPSDDTKCYQFSIVATKHGRPFMVCSGCRSFLYETTKTKSKNPQNSHPIMRKINKYNNLMEDPMLGHNHGCEPMMYSIIMQKCVAVERDQHTLTPPSGFALIKVQRYINYVIHRTLEDTTKGYCFRAFKPSLTGLRVECPKCVALDKKHYQMHWCTSVGFSDDPRKGHVAGCEPIIIDEFSKQLEIITKECAEATMLKRIPRGEVASTTSENKAHHANSNNEFTKFEVIEKIDIVSYIYRIPDDTTTCYRFFTNNVIKAHVSMVCGTCCSINRRRYADGLKGFPERIYRCDGYRMLEDPMKGHCDDCKVDNYSEAMKGYRIIEDDNPVSTNREYPLERRMKIGRRQLILNLESDKTKCYHFHFANHTFKAYCVSCFLARKKRNIHVKTCYKFNGSIFLDDPLIGHECEPLLKTVVFNKHRVVEVESARIFLKFLAARTDNGVFLDVSAPPSAESLIASSKSEIPVHIIEPKNKTISYIYRLKSNPNKCLRFGAYSGVSNYAMRCCRCLDLDNQSSVKHRETDIVSMKLDPSLYHVQMCEPLNYSDILKVYRPSFVKSDREQEYEFCLEQFERRQKFLAVYILPDDPTKCYRFVIRSHSLIDSDVVLRCCGCQRMSTKKDGANPKPLNGLWKASIDGFLEDPRSAHLPGCAPLLYSDVMKDHQLVHESKIFRLFKYGDDGFKDSTVVRDRVGEPLAKKKRTISKKVLFDDVLIDRIDHTSHFILQAKLATRNEPKQSECTPMKKEVKKAAMKYNAIDEASIDVQNRNGLKQFPRASKKMVDAVDNSPIQEIYLDVEINENCEGMSPCERECNVSSPIIEVAMGGIKPNPTDCLPPSSNNVVHPSRIKKEDIKSEIDDALESKRIKAELGTKQEIFSYTFGIPMFSVDEIKLKLDGRTIYVECERVVSEPGVTGGRLAYSVKLPESVDISTLQSVWTEGELELTAQINI